MLKDVMIHLPYEPKPKPVTFGVVTQNWQCALKIYPDGARNPIMIYGEIRQVAARLRDLANQIEGQTVDKWPEPAAPVASSEPVADDELITPPPPDDNRPQQGDIKPWLPLSEKWRLIYYRFAASTQSSKDQSSLADDAELMREVMAQYTRALKMEGDLRRMQRAAWPVDQLSQDVAKLLKERKPEELKRNGKWNQSAIAGALGLPGTGGSYYRRIKAIITELEERAA